MGKKDRVKAVMRFLMILWLAVRRFTRHHGVEVAGYIAYTGLVALFPFLIFLLALAGLLGQVERIQGVLRDAFLFLPPHIAQTLRPIVENIFQQPNAGLMSVGIIGTLWAASTGVEALRLALNESWRVAETRPLWRRRLQSVGFLFVVAISFIAAATLIVAGPFLLHWVMQAAALPVDEAIAWNLLRYVLGAGIIFVFLCALNRVLPNIRIGWKDVWRGALSTTLAWLLLGSVFSLYLVKVAHYNATYGSLGGVVITLLFLHASAIVFIWGADVNAIHFRRKYHQPPEMEEG